MPDLSLLPRLDSDYRLSAGQIAQYQSRVVPLGGMARIMNPALERLGFGPTDRVVIFHADDVVVCHVANVAFLELSRRGLISCGSVMAPCPWFSEAADPAVTRPRCPQWL